MTICPRPVARPAQRGFCPARAFAWFAVICVMAAGAVPLTVRADCQQQLQQLADEMSGVQLTEMQKQTFAGLVESARRHCWVHREKPAAELIVKARQAAGLKPSGREFDWETVPLESLERR